MSVWKGQHLTDLYQCSETVQTFDVPLRLMTPFLSIIGTHTCRTTLLQHETQQQSNYRNVRVFSFPPPLMNTSSPPGDQPTFKWGWFLLQEWPLWNNGPAWGILIAVEPLKICSRQDFLEDQASCSATISLCAFLAHTQMPLGGITANVDVQHRCSVHVQYTQHFHTWLTFQTCKVNPNISWNPGLALWVGNKSAEHGPYCQHLKGEFDLLPTCRALALTHVSKIHRNSGYKYYWLVVKNIYFKKFTGSKRKISRENSWYGVPRSWHTGAGIGRGICKFPIAALS